MLYCKAPDGKLSKPSRVLAGFTKTGNIPSGCEEKVTITAPFRRFASFDDDGRTGLGSTGFVLENEKIYEIPGGECLEIKNETLNYTAPVYSAN